MNMMQKFFYFYFTNYLVVFQSINVIFIIFLISWLFEWLFFFDYVLNFFNSIYLYFPNKVPLLLLVCLVFWIYVWGVSVWRRTQFGRFVRGDRKLWLKGFASFWVVEVVTLTGLLLVSCWMSWGPTIIISRHYWFPKKGFLFELTIFTYVMWLTYLMRFSLKWQLWKTQFFITLIILLILFLLIWRDLITLMFREIVNMDTGANWRYRKTSGIVYSISSIWWLECFLGHHYRDNYSYYSPIEVTLINLLNHRYAHPFRLENVLSLKEFDSYNWLSFNTQSFWWDHIGLFLLSSKNSVNPKYLYIISDPINCIFPTFDLSLIKDSQTIISSDFTNYSGFFYPRRIGFLPKRLAMWFFLVVIKIWHHFMLFIWWFFYLLRLYNRRKSSYTMLSACYFNLYCCYIIGFLVYLYHVLPFLAMHLKFRPQIQCSLRWYTITYECLNYILFIFIGDLFIFKSSHPNLKELAYSELFNEKQKILSVSKNIRLLFAETYLNGMQDFIWSHSFTRLSTIRRLSAVFSTTWGVHWEGNNVFNSTVDIYTYNKWNYWPSVNPALVKKS